MILFSVVGLLVFCGQFQLQPVSSAVRCGF